MSWPFIARNHRHIHLDIEPVRTPVLCEVCLATGRDLNSRDSLSCILSTGVESAACVVSFVKLSVVDLDNIWHNDQLKKSTENICPEITAESLHNPNEFRYFQERVRRKLMNLHCKHVQNRGKNGIAGEPQTAGEEVAKYDNFTVFGGRNLFV
jgi:hypothetical protein